MNSTIRFVMFWLLAVFVIAWYYFTDPDGGQDTIIRLQWLAWMFVISGPVYLLRRAFFDKVRSKEAYDEAMKGNIAAGLVFLGLAIFAGLLFFAFAIRAAGASELPARAYQYIPVLIQEQQAHWPDMPLVSSLPAQVEQETCPSLTSSKCWNPRAELKTSREYGFGLGQLTVTDRFDNFAEARKLDSSLRDWAWEDRYDVRRQLRAMVLMDRGHYRSLRQVPDPFERLAMAFSAYNGGLGGVLTDRRLCSSVPGCDPNKWFGHVEHHSTKAKAAVAGYGKSFFEINREYVRNILIVRRPKYAAYLGQDSE